MPENLNFRLSPIKYDNLKNYQIIPANQTPLSLFFFFFETITNSIDRVGFGFRHRDLVGLVWVDRFTRPTQFTPIFSSNQYL